MGVPRKRGDGGTSGVRMQLEKSADDCESAARVSFTAALDALEYHEDVDNVLAHTTDAIMHLGEARGFRNAIFDLLEDG